MLHTFGLIDIITSENRSRKTHMLITGKCYVKTTFSVKHVNFRLSSIIQVTQVRRCGERAYLCKCSLHDPTKSSKIMI